jgi:hypothetical protein
VALSCLLHSNSHTERFIAHLTELVEEYHYSECEAITCTVRTLHHGSGCWPLYSAIFTADV